MLLAFHHVPMNLGVESVANLPCRARLVNGQAALVDHIDLQAVRTQPASYRG